ncbi:FeoB-associated Cys-rich membrane protein [Clostridium sp. UBA4548]|nr:FeoB-associated Cys-rich membrane protein [Clostridium sp. UBA4548]
MGNIIVGLVFLVIFGFAFKKVYSDTKNNKCSCGSSCSDKSKCSRVKQ